MGAVVVHLHCSPLPLASDQCAGKMIMAGVRQAVWLQDDPLIGASMLKIVEEQDGKTWKTRGYSAGEVSACAVLHLAPPNSTASR